MDTNPSSGPTPRSSSALGPKPAKASAATTPGHVDSDRVGYDGLNEDVHNLLKDVASLKDSFARLASQAGGEAVKTVRNVSQAVASQVGDAASGVADAGSELASSAKEHAKTFASELEGMARRNPLGTIAGVLAVGVIVGMMLRGRS